MQAKWIKLDLDPKSAVNYFAALKLKSINLLSRHKAWVTTHQEYSTAAKLYIPCTHTLVVYVNALVNVSLTIECVE